MIATVTPGQQGPDSVTHSGPASDWGPEGPHRSRTCSLQRAPRLRTTRTGGSPEPIGKLGNLRPQVAKLRTLGFFWPDEMGDIFARRAREGVSYLCTFLRPLQSAALAELAILGGLAP